MLRMTVLFTLMFICLQLKAQKKPLTAESFAIINLNYSGLEKVKTLVGAKKYDAAASALLQYYRQKYGSKKPDFSNAEQPIDINAPLSNDTKEMADNALQHQFKPHKGYGYFNYGEDINWQLWPVKDNEIRWQLHRVRWWVPLALAYYSTKKESYAKEWIYQFSDWAGKNPLGLSKDNDRFAWRPLEVSDRVQSLVPTFTIFINSPHFTPAFLMEFLNSYYQQANYLPKNYADQGNHRLFEAQRVLFAGASFPELKNAPGWRKSGIDVLNSEIKKQVYADGVQFELSPAYHAATIDIFVKAYHGAKKAGMEKEFPASYIQTLEKMALAFINITFPNYDQPMFGDSWIREKDFRLKQFQSWSAMLPQNSFIQYFASDGKEGAKPNWLSHALTTGGFYTFRNGWHSTATVLILKASPPGEFHAQPDNGTFELWVKGRNFMPDAGVYVYSGDAEINRQREEFRQTQWHNTLTLDDKNMVITKAKLQKWETTQNLDILTYTNPSYTNMQHQRSVLFVDQSYFLIIDNAMGAATGKLDVRFHLKEDAKPVYDKTNHTVNTSYEDGNNLLIQSLNKDKVNLLKEESFVSYIYKQKTARPAMAFEKQKLSGKTESFISIVYPYQGQKPPQISLTENAGNNYEKGNINITVNINGKQKHIITNLF